MGDKRLCIFFFYDREGIADRYIDYLLKGLTEVFEDMVIVANGKLEEETRKLFLSYSRKLIERENKGFDVWAYKEALESVGWEGLSHYKEAALVNCTIMGPVYPFSEMFEAMDRKTDLDFWGITTFGKLDQDPFGFSPYGYLPEHIQSHFIVVRNRMLTSRHFRNYWEKMPEINSYEESIGLHESVFTKKFADWGYKWDTYVHSPKDNPTSYYLMMDPVRAVREDRCPIFKRRSFFQPAIHYINESAGEQPYELYRYLETNTDYDVGMILENLIRTCHQDDFVRTLRLNYILPSRTRLFRRAHALKVAAVMHLYYMDMLENSIHYALSLPEDSDIYITTADENSIPVIRKAFAEKGLNPEIILIENRGRDVSSLLVGARNIQDQYDLVCFFHDKKTNQVKPYTTGQSFAYKVSEAVLSTREYVDNLIGTFEDNPKLGMVMSPPPNHADFLTTLAWEWGQNYEITHKLVQELGFRVPVSIEHPPIAPLGTVFWYRTAALKPLFQKEWKYEDFPPEPNENDGTILHAIERIYSLTVQEAGFYPAYAMPDHLAALEISNLSYYVRMYNFVRLKHGIYGDFNQVLGQEEERFETPPVDFNLMALANSANLSTQIRLWIKRHFPKPVYRAIVGVKRTLVGPRGITQDEAEIGDPK